MNLSSQVVTKLGGPNIITSVLFLFSCKKFLDIQRLMSSRQLKGFFTEQVQSDVTDKTVCHLHNSDIEYCISERQSQGEVCIVRIKEGLKLNHGGYQIKWEQVTKNSSLF